MMFLKGKPKADLPPSLSPLTSPTCQSIFNHMVKYNTAQIDATFSALGDATRREMLARLARGSTSVTELAKPFPISLPAVSKHLKVLEGAGLIIREKEGQVRRCHLKPEPLKEASDWISHYQRFWEGQLDNLERYFSQTHPKEDGSWKRKQKARNKKSR